MSEETRDKLIEKAIREAEKHKVTFDFLETPRKTRRRRR